ncbi:hypothetical protein SCP_1701020 [Sparassis crispa]|uniref:Uncharacterized protein n=1 Tax=Sparassis crispa TaxID=139825 RepID=A0A401H5R0_9APHY|nr:hypothetical protein SCP_1701020 [Sparassis crispa]GBE89777.1 hypothetical protein SCP_1701020 [Sparassis crispa]
MPDVKHEDVMAYAPDLARTPVELIRKGLPGMHRHVPPILLGVRCDPPKTVLRKVKGMSVPDSRLAECPTHIFAVYGPSWGSTSPADRYLQKLRARRLVTYYPIHALMFLAHCGNLPPIEDYRLRLAILHVTPPTATVEAASIIRVPLVPIYVPAPVAFQLLEHYIYFSNVPHLEAELLPSELPPPPRAPGIISHDDRVAAYAYALATQQDMTINRLSRHAKLVYRLYQNVVWLAVKDSGLWAAINFTWESLTSAMRMMQQWGMTV